jgi:hypothetical protein
MQLLKTKLILSPIVNAEILPMFRMQEIATNIHTTSHKTKAEDILTIFDIKEKLGNVAQALAEFKANINFIGIESKEPAYLIKKLIKNILSMSGRNF